MVEINRTEGIAIIGNRRCSGWCNSEFYALWLGPMPVPLWAIPTQRRLENI